MYTLKAAGENTIGNLRADNNPIPLSKYLIQSFDANGGSISIPSQGPVTATVTGKFTFNGTPQTAADVAGMLFSTNVFKNGVLAQAETWSAGADVQRIDDYPYSLSLLSGNDYFEGSATTAGDDYIQGLGGNDRFQGYGSGQYGDYFIGGDGTDTSIYQGKISDYVIKADSAIWDNMLNNGSRIAGFTVQDSVKSRDGFDKLVAVERLEFKVAEANGANRVALDVGPSQNAGSIYMLYKAAFNRAPDVGGMGYWLDKKDAGADISTEIAQGFLNSAEFKAIYGSNPSNALYVDKLYLNVLGRAGEAEGVAYWNTVLNEHRYDQAKVLVLFASSPEGASNVATLVGNGIAYQELLGI
jgi:hypothetical protein